MSLGDQIKFNREKQEFYWDDVVLPHDKATSLYHFMCLQIKAGGFKPEGKLCKDEEIPIV